MARDTIRAYPSQAKNDVARATYRELVKLALEVRQLAYAALSPAGLAIGTVSKAKVLIANTVTYLSGGVFKSKTTAEVAFTATTHDIPAHATLVQEAVYLLCLDAGGTPTIEMGAIASGAGNAVIPAPPDGKTVIGHVRIAVDAGATSFDATTDELDEAHLTVTYTDTATLLVGEYAKTVLGGA